MQTSHSAMQTYELIPFSKHVAQTTEKKEIIDPAAHDSQRDADASRLTCTCLRTSTALQDALA